MKKLIAVIALSLVSLFAPQRVSSQAVQPRVLLGLSGSDAFDNLSAGLMAGLEIPIRRVELDFADSYSPYESHMGLGQGHANIASFGTHVWLTSKFGLTGKIEDSGYSVTQVSKTGFYSEGGMSVRTYLGGLPSRIEFGYTQQVNNGIVNGVETSHLRGAYFGTDTRLGCAGFGCFRMSEQFSIGKVLTQGNPVCDGTLGNGSQIGESYCPRGSAVGGGVTVSLTMEFPRHRGHEDDLF